MKKIESMKMVIGYPPNYTEIRDRFNLSGRRVVFAYGDNLYNPTSLEIPDHLWVHEKTHQVQQFTFKTGVEGWWKTYLDNPHFRMTQEVEAYKAQVEFYSRTHGRNERRFFMNLIAKDLSSEMYGNMLSKDKALELIKVK